MSKDVLVVKDLNMHYETLSGDVSAGKTVSFTVKEGVFSLWNGHRPKRLTPLFLRVTKSETTSSMRAASKIWSIVSFGIIFFF